MGKDDVAIMDMVEMQNNIRQAYYKESGFPETTPVLQGLASGLDSTLTIMEVSVGPFEGMTKENASKVRDYFLHESYSYKNVNPEVAIWYLSWAKTLENLFIKK